MTNSLFFFLPFIAFWKRALHFNKSEETILTSIKLIGAHSKSPVSCRVQSSNVRLLSKMKFCLAMILIDPFNVCKHRKPRLGARAAWGQKNGAANRPAYCVKEKQTSLIDR